MQAVAGKAVSKLQAIQEAVKAVGGTAATELLGLPCAPPLTWNILRALLLVLGKPSQQVDSWLKCRYCLAALRFDKSCLLLRLKISSAQKQHGICPCWFRVAAASDAFLCVFGSGLHPVALQKLKCTWLMYDT